MRLPFNWLKEFVAVPDDAQGLADKLTMRGLEVEAVEAFAPAFTDVYVGEIVEMGPHPSADRLALCRVDTGREVLPIVCGAPNVAKGQKVPVAAPGARLPGGVVIEKKRLRGVESVGMLLSEKELGLSDDASGLFILPAKAGKGAPLSGMLEITDWVLDVNVPPNRGDCQSVLGLAREVAAIYGAQVTLPDFTLQEQSPIDGLIGLSILDAEACPRYVLRMVRGISIVPSPFLMRSRIAKAGMRPINSIVDVTNYIMLELGQPLHAFDYARIADRRIEVRTADRKTVFRTLDGQDRALEAGDLMICDGSGPVAIAGIMGGENSEISAATRDVALESAFFNPLFIRRTARRLDLRSEASARFEKGIDIEGTDYAAKKAIWLMQQISGGEAPAGSAEFYAKKPGRTIALGPARCRDLIGAEITDAQVGESLASIGLKAVTTEGDRVTFSIPSYRHDLSEYCDLVEEVARIIGYDAIPASAPVSPLLPVPVGRGEAVIDAAKTYLTSCGFFEAINYGFFGIRDIEAFRLNTGAAKDDEESASDERTAYVPLLNPISKELGVMRTILAAGLLKNIAYNTHRGAKNVRLFEVGKVFTMSGASELPRESMHLAVAACGSEGEDFWRDAAREIDFFDLKGALEGLCERLGVDLGVGPTNEPFLEPRTSADLFIDGVRIGWIGSAAGEVTSAFDVDDRAWCAEIDLDAIIGKEAVERAYKPISRYPAVTRDFSFYVDDSIPAADIVAAISAVSPLIVSAGVFDIFSKKEVRSISVRVVFQSYEDTLTDEQVNGLQQVIIDRLTKRKGITLRT